MFINSLTHIYTQEDYRLNEVKFSNGIYDGYNMFETGIQVGSIKMLEFVCAQQAYINFSRDNLNTLIKLGHLDCFIYVHKLCGDDIWNRKSYKIAARHGRIEILKYIYQNRMCDYHHSVIMKAIKYGQLDCVKYLHEKSKVNGIDQTICHHTAIMYNHFEILKFLCEKKYYWDSDCCTIAVRGGHFEILKYLHENRCPWDSNSCTAAVSNGQYEILKYLHENGCPWDKFTCYASIGSENLDTNSMIEMFNYLYENNCPQGAFCREYIIEAQNIKLLKHLRKNGYVWNEEENIH